MASTINSTVITFLKNVNRAILNPLIVLMFAVALLVFIYGVFEFVRGGSSEDARSQGSRHMFWGIFGLFIMISAFGLINIIANTVGADTNDIRQVVPL